MSDGRTWVVGDIHGCADALSRLLAEIALGPEDRLLSAGDLFHRGADPLGVLAQLLALDERFGMVLGNHEWAMQQRIGASGGSLADLRGDGDTALAPMAAADALRLLAFLDKRPAMLEGVRPDGQKWCLFHGAALPSCPLPPVPLLLETWQGPALVVFGHRQSLAGPHRNAQAEAVAWGLDTGCVYGGELTALCLEDLSTVVVPATA